MAGGRPLGRGRPRRRPRTLRTLSLLRHLVAELTLDELTAVVTVADNGGSSGRLRGEFGVLPPGDLRMALAALCGDDEWGRTWAEVVQHRFAGDGEMRGHVVGNLLIVGLWELMGDPVRALDLVGRLLGARGRVLPMSTTPIDITAEVRGPGRRRSRRAHRVRGQVEVATTGGQIESRRPRPPDAGGVRGGGRGGAWPPTGSCSGPGSWFTSVIPHLMVPALRRGARGHARGRLVVVLNLEAQAGETPGFGPEDHLAALFEHAPDLKVHTVLADAGSVADAEASWRRRCSTSARRLVIADIAAATAAPRHDPARLAAGLRRRS